MKVSTDFLENITTSYDGRLTDITSVHYIGPVSNPVENDVFNTDLSNVLQDPFTTISEDSNLVLKTGENYCFIPYDIADLGVKDYYTIKPDERLFMLLNVRSDEDREVIINFGVGHRIRVWVNGDFVSSNILFSNCFLAMKLVKGDNLFFIEVESVYTGSRLGMRINEYNDELFGISGKLASTIGARLVNDFAIVSKGNELAGDTDTYYFMIVPKDLINVADNNLATVNVYDEYENKLDEFQAAIRKPVSYDLKDTLGKCRFISLNITLDTISKETMILHHDVLLDSVDEELIYLKKTYEKTKNEYNLNEEDIINIERRLYNIERISNGVPPSMITEDDLRDKPVIHEIKELTLILDSLSRGEHFSDLILRNVISHVYYKSHMDDRTEMYSLCLPIDYSDKKSYPMIIFLPVCSPDARWEYLKPIINEEVIMLDTSLKGWTLGSYIGEAAVFEVLEKVFSKYNVDRTRIYVTGHSNGGYATFILAQNHPDLFAAIAPISGCPYLPNVKNLTNVNVLSIYGEADQQSVIKTLASTAETLKPNGRYEDISAPQSPHNSVWVAMYSKYVLNWLLKHRKPELPKRVTLRTERLRHNKQYWIEIQKIGSEKSYCEIDAEIINDSTIHIQTDNVDEFTLDISTSMNTQDLSVTVNSNTLHYDSNNDNKMHIKRDGDTYHQISNTLSQGFSSSSQGMGILDIFMDRVKIVTPSRYSSEDEKNAIEKVASEFSSPRTMGLYLTLRINYSIVNDSELTDDDINDCNLVLIGVNENNKIIEQIKTFLTFGFSKNGYKYLNTDFTGDYTLMYIAPNPLNTMKKALIIYSNNHTFFQKNLFTRQLVLPSYLNGIHPYLNSDVMIHDGNTYSYVKNLGEEIITSNEEIGFPR